MSFLVPVLELLVLMLAFHFLRLVPMRLLVILLDLVQLKKYLVLGLELLVLGLAVCLLRLVPVRLLALIIALV